MALVLNEEQRLLQDTTREFLAKHAPVEALRKLRDESDPVGYDPELWQQMAEMGGEHLVVVLLVVARVLTGLDGRRGRWWPLLDENLVP